MLFRSATPVLIIHANKSHDSYAIVGAAIFGATLINLYLSSTLYHSLSKTRARRVFQILDHAAIYLLIAGTYTPFTIGVLRGPWGMLLHWQTETVSCFRGGSARQSI